MKHLLIIFLFISSFAIAQDKVSIGLFQDTNLALFKDKHGNTPFTLDVNVRGEFQGKQFKNYYFYLLVDFEYANLYGGEYSRFSVGSGWTFNNLVMDELELSISTSTGMIWRWEHSYLNVWMINGEIAYKINDHWKISLLAQFLNREDLRGDEKLDNLKDYIKGSGFIGLKYTL